MLFEKNKGYCSQLWETGRNQVRTWLMAWKQLVILKDTRQSSKSCDDAAAQRKLRPGNGSWILRLEVKAIFNWKIKEGWSVFFGHVFRIQGGSWPGWGLTTINSISIWENSQWNVHSAHCQLQQPPKKSEFVWLHFLMGPGRSGQFYAIVPCKTEGQHKHGRKQLPSRPRWLVDKRSHLADELWPLGAPGGVVSLNTTCKAGLNLAGYKLALRIVEESFG